MKEWLTKKTWDKRDSLFSKWYAGIIVAPPLFDYILGKFGSYWEGIGILIMFFGSAIVMAIWVTPPTLIKK